MLSNLDLARDFYAVLGRADADRLGELLHPQFTGHATDRTPAGLGGTHEPRLRARTALAGTENAQRPDRTRGPDNISGRPARLGA